VTYVHICGRHRHRIDSETASALPHAGVASTLVAVEWNFSTIARAVWGGMNTVPDGQVQFG
jgi:hypothetical protein